MSNEKVLADILAELMTRVSDLYAQNTVEYPLVIPNIDGESGLPLDPPFTVSSDPLAGTTIGIHRDRNNFQLDYSVEYDPSVNPPFGYPYIEGTGPGNFYSIVDFLAVTYRNVDSNSRAIDRAAHDLPNLITTAVTNAAQYGPYIPSFADPLYNDVLIETAYVGGWNDVPLTNPYGRKITIGYADPLNRPAFLYFGDHAERVSWAGLPVRWVGGVTSGPAFALVTVLQVIMIPMSAPVAQASPDTLIMDLYDVPEIMAQAETGRECRAGLVTADGSHMTVAYGDWNYNTAATNVVAVDLQNKTASVVLSDFRTEAQDRWRSDDAGNLYAPSIDPLGGENASFVTNATGSWTKVPITPPAGLGPLVHCFDILKTNAGTVHVVGSRDLSESEKLSIRYGPSNASAYSASLDSSMAVVWSLAAGANPEADWVERVAEHGIYQSGDDRFYSFGRVGPDKYFVPSMRDRTKVWILKASDNSWRVTDFGKGYQYTGDYRQADNLLWDRTYPYCWFGRSPWSRYAFSTPAKQVLFYDAYGDGVPHPNETAPDRVLALCPVPNYNGYVKTSQSGFVSYGFTPITQTIGNYPVTAAMAPDGSVYYITECRYLYKVTGTGA